MINIESFRQIALSFPETTEAPHFEKPSFKVTNKLFVTLNTTESRATIKLSEADQDIFCLFDKTVIYPVPNKWGKQGWTHLNLKTINEKMCIDALKTAYCEVAPKRLSSLINFD